MEGSESHRTPDVVVNDAETTTTPSEAVDNTQPVDMDIVDSPMDTINDSTALSDSTQSPPASQEPQRDTAPTTGTGQLGSSIIEQYRSALMHDATMNAHRHQAVEEDDDLDPAMPGLEPLSYTPSPNDTPGTEVSRSGASTPLRSNRRPRVEDDQDADRDRRHPSERTGNAYTSVSSGLEIANEPMLFLFYIYPSNSHRDTPYTGPIPAPRVEADGRPFGGVPFSLFGHRHNFTAPPPRSNSAPHNGSGSGSAAPANPAVPDQGNSAAQAFSFSTSGTTGVAITFDLLRGGPPIIRHVDENFRMHTHEGLHAHHNHNQPPAANAPSEQGTAVPPSAASQANVEAPPSNPNTGPGGAQTNLRDNFLSTEELLRQIRSMTDVLTSALGGMESMGEDKEKGKLVIRGLEEVPEGLAKRMDAVAKANGDGNGFGGCAICFDSLLEDAGFGVEAEPKPAGVSQHTAQPAAAGGRQEAQTNVDTPSTSAPSDNPPVESAGTSTTQEADKEAPLPKIVVLPCSHAFHSSCLIPWFSKPMRTTCPSCRFNIDPEGLIWSLGRRPMMEPGAAGGLGGMGAGLGATAFGPFTLPAGFSFFGGPRRGTDPNRPAGTANEGDAAPAGQQPGVSIGGFNFDFNGMGVPLMFTEGDRRRAGVQPQRRAQSVPRRRTQSLPREATPGQPGTALDDMNLDGGPTWTRVTDRPNLPQLPPGAHRTVYHTHLPIGGVDVIFDVIPVNIPRNNSGAAPQQRAAAGDANGTNGAADANAPNALPGGNPPEGGFLPFAMNMFDDDPGMDVDDDTMDINEFMNHVNQNPFPLLPPPRPTFQPNSPSGQTAQAQTPPQANSTGVPSTPAQRSGGFLQSIFGGLLHNHHNNPPARDPAVGPQDASASSGSAGQPEQGGVPSAASSDQPPQDNPSASPMFERIVSRTIGAVFDHVLAGMPGGFLAARGGSRTPAPDGRPAANSPPSSQPAQPDTAPPQSNGESLPQPRPQTIEQAAATGLPTGVPAQLASNSGNAPATTLPSTNTPLTPRMSTTDFEAMIRRLEPLFGPASPDMVEDLRRDYESFVAHHEQDYLRHLDRLHQLQDLHGIPRTPASTFAAPPPDARPPTLTQLIGQRLPPLAPLPDVPTGPQQDDNTNRPHIHFNSFTIPLFGFGRGAANAAPGTGADPAGAQPEGTAPPQATFDVPPLPRFGHRGRPRAPQETKKWTPPPAPGTTLRQRVEKMEKEAGFRCDDVSCGVGPSDEDPIVSEAVTAMRQLSIHHSANHEPSDEAGKSVCQHTFHPTCLVTSERVSLQGNEEQVHGSEVEVTCPVCRHSGCISKEAWDTGAEVTL